MNDSQLTGDIAIDFSPDDAQAEYAALLREAEQRLTTLPTTASDVERARVHLDIATARTGMAEANAAWDLARQALDTFVAAEAWQDAVEACEVLYKTELPAAAAALAHGVWLAVTYPVQPITTITLLMHVVEETPPNSDGGAVAAAVAHYIAGVRAGSDAEFESLSFLTRNELAKVAARHSTVTTQEQLDFWVAKLELNDPAKFLPRLGRVLDLIVGEHWWFDRDALRQRLPVN
ncbi:MAG: hypothetical protein ACFCUJ_00355 [Thiotrichales bacterium]